MTNTLKPETAPPSFPSALGNLFARGGWPAPSYLARLDLHGIGRVEMELETVSSQVGQIVLEGELDGVLVQVRLEERPDGFDEHVSVTLPSSCEGVQSWRIGFVFPAEHLDGFRVSPVPFKVGMDGADRTVTLDGQNLPESWAEGWIVENGSQGFLLMRVPTGDSETCFVPFGPSEDGSLGIGSLGNDGDDHRTRNIFLGKTPPAVIHVPPARWAFFDGDWEEGIRLFRSNVSAALRRPRAYRPSPVTYNTYHDFGPHYTREDIVSLLPALRDLGFGLLHLDPGWEKDWGSTEWGEEHMGSPDEIVRIAAGYGLKVGCWTALHPQSAELPGGFYTLDSKGEKYVAEDFGPVLLKGMCPLSGWREMMFANLSRLVRAGFVFINSDFHDWPWNGESCHATDHGHSRIPSRAEWALAVNQAFGALHEADPDLVVEMHDHVESGEYRTPVWYLYDRPGSYDEKWAYEFMWKTFENLLEGKLFSLYHIRKAEPIPLFLHMHMPSDNPNALAFWYVASCVNHIGVGGVRKSPPEVVEGYRRAIALYNQHFLEFTCGEFVGIDELTHLHIHPRGDSAALLCFNLGEKTVTRTVSLNPGAWGADIREVRSGDIPLACHPDGRYSLEVTIGAQDVVLVPLTFVS